MPIRKRANGQPVAASRRTLLRQMASLSLGLPMSGAGMLPLLGESPAGQGQEQHTSPAAPPEPTVLSPEDDQFLNDLEHANFLFFWEQGNPADRTDQGSLQRSRQ